MALESRIDDKRNKIQLQNTAPGWVSYYQIPIPAFVHINLAEWVQL